MLFPANLNREQYVRGENHPDDRDQNLDGPFQLRIFFSHRKAEGQSERRADNDQLPAPEMGAAQHIREQTSLQQALGGMVDPGKDRIPGESKDGGIGVQGT